MAHAEADLRAIPHTTLLVHGRDDVVIPVSTTLTMLEWISDSQAHIFGRCGHWTQIEHADAFAALLTTFFDAGRHTDPMSEHIVIEVGDGTLPAVLWQPGPDTANGAGIVLVQEIFGLSEYIPCAAAAARRPRVCRPAPAVFWRLGTTAVPNGPQMLDEALALAGRVDWLTAVSDVAAAVRPCAREESPATSGSSASASAAGSASRSPPLPRPTRWSAYGSAPADLARPRAPGDLPEPAPPPGPPTPISTGRPRSGSARLSRATRRPSSTPTRVPTTPSTTLTSSSTTRTPRGLPGRGPSTSSVATCRPEHPVSDLHCPATLVLARLPNHDPIDAAGALGALVAGQPSLRFARLYAGPDDTGMTCGAVVGDVLGVPPTILTGLTVPPAEADRAECRFALEEVVGTPLTSIAVRGCSRSCPPLSWTPGSGPGAAPSTPPVTVVVDADGWSVRSGLPATS